MQMGPIDNAGCHAFGRGHGQGPACCQQVLALLLGEFARLGRGLNRQPVGGAGKITLRLVTQLGAHDIHGMADEALKVAPRDMPPQKVVHDARGLHREPIVVEDERDDEQDAIVELQPAENHVEHGQALKEKTAPDRATLTAALRVLEEKAAMEADLAQHADWLREQARVRGLRYQILWQNTHGHWLWVGLLLFVLAGLLGITLMNIAAVFVLGVLILLFAVVGAILLVLWSCSHLRDAYGLATLRTALFPWTCVGKC